VDVNAESSALPTANREAFRRDAFIKLMHVLSPQWSADSPNRSTA
jgi:hypothetical protein